MASQSVSNNSVHSSNRVNSSDNSAYEAAQERAVTLPQTPALEIVMPLAASLLKNFLLPEDVFERRYNLHDMVDWLMDALPAALAECDHVALKRYLDECRAHAEQ